MMYILLRLFLVLILVTCKGSTTSTSPETATINKEELFASLIDQWNIEYEVESSHTTVPWNPLSLLLDINTLFDSYDLYTKKNAGNALLLLMLRHIALGKEASINDYTNFDALDSTLLSLEIEKIQEQLTAYGQYFIPSLLRRSSEIIIKGYRKEKQALFTTIIEKIATTHEELFKKTKAELGLLRKQDAENVEVALEDIVVNTIPIVCHKVPKTPNLQQKIIASTDSQGSFVPLLPLRHLMQFINEPSENDELFINVHCGDNVDRFGKGCEESNLLGLIAYPIIRAVTLLLNEEFRRILGKRNKKIIFMLPPGNHDLWHTPTEYQSGNWRDWYEIKRIIEMYHLNGSDNNVSFQNYYFLFTMIVPKVDIVLMTNEHNEPVQMFHGQHSCFNELPILEDTGMLIKEGSWLTWGRRPEIQNVAQLESSIHNTGNNFVGARAIINFLLAKKRNFYTTLLEALTYSSTAWHLQNNVALIDIIRLYNPTTWFDFDFKKICEDEENRGYYIHPALVQLLEYVFLYNNYYTKVTNVVQFFGHNHRSDQELVKLINFTLQSPPYPLNHTFDEYYDPTEQSGEVLGYTKRMICHYKNKKKDIFSHQGIVPMFLPISPKSKLELSREMIEKYYKKKIGGIEHFLKNVLEDENISLDATLATEDLPLQLPYYVVLSEGVCTYKSFLEMHNQSFSDLFAPEKQAEGVTILPKSSDNEKKKQQNTSFFSFLLNEIVQLFKKK